MEAYGIVVGVKFTSLPGEQFTLRREVYARLRDAFLAADIRFARPRIHVEATGHDARTEDIGVAAMPLIEAAPDADGGVGTAGP